MVETPTGIDLALSGAVTSDNDAVTSLAVSALVDNTPEDIGFMYPRGDVAEGRPPNAIHEYRHVSNKDLVATLDKLDEQIRDQVHELLTANPTIYHTPFGLYLQIDTSNWEKYFGESPSGPIESWEPIWQYGKEQFGATYQQNGMDRRGHSTSLEPFEHIFENDDTHILPVRITPALALSEVGTMSLPQAQALVLHQWGYETSAIADILEKPDGTVSSHLNRGKKKATRAQWMTEYLKDTDKSQPVDYPHILDRVGKVYEARGGRQWRIVGIGDIDGELEYEMLSEDRSTTIPVGEFAEMGRSYTEIPLSEASKNLKEADVMDVGDFIPDHLTDEEDSP